eukprot:gene56763-75795_t
MAGPSRDLLVKRSTPDNASGRVYGVVYAGLDIGQAVTPLVFGVLMDHGQYRSVLLGLVLLQGVLVASAFKVRKARRTVLTFFKGRTMRYLSNFPVIAVSVLLAGAAAAQPAPISYKLTGDVGAAVYGTQSIIRGKKNEAIVLPYLFADYGRFFARVDTLGFKTLPMGNGYLELVGRVSQDGWRANIAPLGGLTDRQTPLPIGIGTFQQTPYGAWIVNAFVNAGSGRGNLLEATYAAEVKPGSLSLYPQLG